MKIRRNPSPRFIRLDPFIVPCLVLSLDIPDTRDTMLLQFEKQLFYKQAVELRQLSGNRGRDSVFYSEFCLDILLGLTRGKTVFLGGSNQWLVGLVLKGEID